MMLRCGEAFPGNGALPRKFLADKGIRYAEAENKKGSEEVANNAANMKSKVPTTTTSAAKQTTNERNAHHYHEESISRVGDGKGGKAVQEIQVF